MQLVPAIGQFNWTKWRKLNAYNNMTIRSRLHKKKKLNYTPKIEDFIIILHSVKMNCMSINAEYTFDKLHLALSRIDNCFDSRPFTFLIKGCTNYKM